MRMKVWYDKLKGLITEVPADCTRVLFEVLDEEDASLGVLEADFGDLPDIIQTQVSLYGLNKLLTDRTSEKKDKREKLDAMEQTLELLMSGEWTKERTVGAVVVSPEVEALATMQGMSVPDTQAALAQYDKDVRKSILAREDVQEAAKKIREARKDAAVKTLDDLIPES